jgi:hypothetical protein
MADEDQPLNVSLTVNSPAIWAALSLGQDADPLVVPDGLDVNAG